LDDPNDFVRIEVESALRNPSVLVIPVLVDNANMPVAEQLPDSLEELAYRNAVKVRTDPDFPHDMDMLIRQLKSSKRTPDLAQFIMGGVASDCAAHCRFLPVSNFKRLRV